MNKPRLKIVKKTMDVAGHPMPCEITYIDGEPRSIRWLDTEAMHALQTEHIVKHGEPAIHATPCSGQISIQDIRNEFYGGGGPANLGELGANLIGRPWGQQIALSEFYCRSGVPPFPWYPATVTNTAGRWDIGSNPINAGFLHDGTMDTNVYMWGNTWITIDFPQVLLPARKITSYSIHAQQGGGSGSRREIIIFDAHYGESGAAVLTNGATINVTIPGNTPAGAAIKITAHGTGDSGDASGIGEFWITGVTFG